jgi:hypothetical protein
MVVFLLISIYHFGQADMEDFFGETHVKAHCPACCVQVSVHESQNIKH